MLARQGKYNDCLFHRLVPGFMVRISSALSFSANNVGQVQTGDPTGTGTGGQSYWGTPFRDEYDLKGAARHDSRGVVAMANKGANTNGSVLPAFSLHKTSFTTFHRSQFYITFKPAPNLDKKHTVFGKLVGGEDVLDTLEKLSRKEGTERPAKPVNITEVVMYVAHTSAVSIAETNVIQLSRPLRGLQNSAGQETREESGGAELSWYPANDCRKEARRWHELVRGQARRGGCYQRIWRWRFRTWWRWEIPQPEEATTNCSRRNGAPQEEKDRVWGIREFLVTSFFFVRFQLFQV
jgi:peptidyl-prolyl cis-trans isomerase-like protein 2